MRHLKNGTENALPWAGHRKGMHLQSDGRGGSWSLVCSIQLYEAITSTYDAIIDEFKLV